MKYRIEEAKKEDLEILKKYKLSSILDYASNLEEKEITI